MTIFPIQSGLLQGNLDANNFGIDNLDVSSLGLVKGDVGLGNVDNTSDVDKPVSTLQSAALALKEPVIAPGTTSQFLIGDKTWLNFGALALQDGNTTLPLLAAKGASAASTSSIIANRNDFVSSVEITQLGASVLGNVLTSLPGANIGMLAFNADSFAVIKTDNSAPIIFGTNNTIRMQLRQGLNVGGSTDPGSGCITAFGTISGGQLVGSGSGITGLVKNQIPTTLNATTVPNLTISGAGTTAYVAFTAGGWGGPPQTDTPEFNTAIYANSLGRLAFRCFDTNFDFSFNTTLLTANRTLSVLNTAGSIPVVVAVPATATSVGVAGAVAYDATHFYVCKSTDSWIRATFSAW